MGIYIVLLYALIGTTYTTTHAAEKSPDRDRKAQTATQYFSLISLSTMGTLRCFIPRQNSQKSFVHFKGLFTVPHQLYTGIQSATETLAGKDMHLYTNGSAAYNVINNPENRTWLCVSLDTPYTPCNSVYTIKTCSQVPFLVEKVCDEYGIGVLIRSLSNADELVIVSNVQNLLLRGEYYTDQTITEDSPKRLLQNPLVKSNPKSTKQFTPNLKDYLILSRSVSFDAFIAKRTTKESTEIPPVPAIPIQSSEYSETSSSSSALSTSSSTSSSSSSPLSSIASSKPDADDVWLVLPDSHMNENELGENFEIYQPIEQDDQGI